MSEQEFDTVAWLPYTSRKVSPKQQAIRADHFPKGDAEVTHRLSHFSARAIAAALYLSKLYLTPNMILTGEGKNPSTAELAGEYLRRRECQANIRMFGDLNGTQEQIDLITYLQEKGDIGGVIIPAFNFHVPRVRELAKIWGLKSRVVEIEDTHQAYLDLLARGVGSCHQDLDNRSLGQKLTSVTDGHRVAWLGLPQVEELVKVEQGIPKMTVNIDRRFGRAVPLSRLLKAVSGPTLTDIDIVGLPRFGRYKALPQPDKGYGQAVLQRLTPA